MPASSPPKRVTRARAAARKATDEANSSMKKTAAANASAPKRAKMPAPELLESDTIHTAEVSTKRVTRAPSTARVAAARRRIKVTPLDAPLPRDEPENQPAQERSETKKSKSTSKSVKAALTSEEKETAKRTLDTIELAIQPKARGKNPAAKPDDGAQLAPKTRGRPRKAEVAAVEEPSKVAKPGRTGLAATVSGTTASNSTETSSTMMMAPARKKVTFQGVPENDKENLSGVSKKSTTRSQNAPAAGGMRAKPIRKHSSAKSTKGSVAMKKDKSMVEAPTPLSPKKVTQVTKSPSPCGSDDDELSGGKTPVRDLSQSPKRILNLNGPESPVKLLDFASGLVPNSARVPSISTVMFSPARRIPPSPFKDSLKESPKRGETAPVFSLPAAGSSTVSRLVEIAPDTQRNLLQSPKRGAVDSSIFLQSAMKPQTSPFKASLLQSPPKRLAFPIKTKITLITPARVQPSMPGNELDTVIGSPDTVVSCHFRASKSPERSSRVHKISEEELAQENQGVVDFDEPVLDIRSPIKISKSTQNYPRPIHEETESMQFIENDPNMSDERSECAPQCIDGIDNSDETDWNDEAEPMERVLKTSEIVSITPVTKLTARSAALSTFLFRAPSSPGDEDSPDDEGSSEDELLAENSPVKGFQVGTSTTEPIASLGAKPRLSTIKPIETSKSEGFTPLAAQLSSWLASSPTKKSKRRTQEQGIFSPVAAQHVPGLVQISRHSTPAHRFEEGTKPMTVQRDQSGEKHLAKRTSLASSISGTPNKAHFFADEMAIKEIEREIENMHSENYGEHFNPGGANPYESARKAINDTTQESVIQPVVFEIANSNVEDNSQNDAFEDTQQDAYQKETESIFSQYVSEGLAESVISVEGLSQDATANGNLASPSESDDGMPLSEQNLNENDAENNILRARVSQSPHPSSSIPSPKTQIPLSDIATPVRQDLSLPRFVNTVVSKVPLRPECSISPSRVPQKRSRSLSAGSSPRKAPSFTSNAISKSNTVISLSPVRKSMTPAVETPGQQSFLVDDFGDSTLDGIEVDEDDENLPPPTPTATIRSTIAAPARTPLNAGKFGVLQGAVVFVDVHTTEGADASGIFVDLLSQMGAKCIKQWNWNPRASAMGGSSHNEDPSASTSGKIGITHVIYKDGGKRTLEKVRDAGGVVKCVGVGWVLDCERENKWLNESQYVVDVSIPPRGGSRRRKSMEPKALRNMNGNLSAAKTKGSGSGEMTAAMNADLISTPVRSEACLIRDENDSPSESEEDMEHDISSLSSSFSTPTGVQAAFGMSTTSDSAAAGVLCTPTGQVNYDPSSASPTTPYYMSQGAKLVQQTCPPKQTNRGLFEDRRTSRLPLSGCIEDQPDEGIRLRLEAARRKTMNWRPRIASPLTR